MLYVKRKRYRAIFVWDYVASTLVSIQIKKISALILFALLTFLAMKIFIAFPLTDSTSMHCHSNERNPLHHHFRKLYFTRLLRISRSDDQFLINQYISQIGWICRNPLPGSSFTDNLCARLSWKIFICPKTVENFLKIDSLLNPLAGDLCVQLLRGIVRQRRRCLADFFPNLGFLNKSFLGN